MDGGGTEESGRKESTTEIKLELVRSCESALLPQLFPHPDLVAGLDWIAELMGEHAYLSAMVDVMHHHVGEHRRTTRPAT